MSFPKSTLLALYLILISGRAFAQQKGDTVVVIKDSQIKGGDKVLERVQRGLSMKVVEVEEQRIRVDYGVIGWMPRADLVLLDDATDVFNEQIRRSPKDSGAYAARGLVSGRKRQFDKAIADLNTAV